MNTLRVLHAFDDPSVEFTGLVDYTTWMRSRDGAQEAEVYRSISDSTRVALVSCWRDQDAFASCWDEVLADPSRHPILAAVTGDATTEFYHRETFRKDRVWISEAYAKRGPTIFWPARGAVRIIIQTGGVEATIPFLLADQTATRREPGCQQYEWWQGAESPEDLLLLELWQNQAIYDAHWNLRIATKNPATTGGASLPPRSYGTSSSEFYRHQRFEHLYDRWLPAELHRRSEAVVWSH